MYSRWTQHLSTEEEKENFRREVRSAKSVLDRLNKMVEEDLEALERSEMNPKAYEQASWPYHQAHKNGIKQYAVQMKTLTNLDQQKAQNEPIRN